MRLNEIISGVRSFYVKEDIELILNAKKELLKNRIKVASKVDDVNYNVINGNLVYNSNESVFINDSKLLDKEYFKCGLETGIILLGSDFEVDYPNYIGKYYLFDIDKKIFIFDKNLSNNALSFKTNNEFFYTDRRKIYALSICINPPELWQFDLSQFGQWYLDTNDARNYEVSKFLGTYKDALLIVCNSGRLFSLHIHTGELLHYWDTYPIVGESKHNSFSESMELDLERGEVVGMDHNVMWKVDLDTNIVYSYSLTDKFGQYDYEYITAMSSFPITESHYYLVLNTKHMERIDDRQQGIVALNKDTLEIDWHYLFDEGEWVSSRKMQVTKTHLYLLDSNSNLYIFEKE